MINELLYKRIKKDISFEMIYINARFIPAYILLDYDEIKKIKWDDRLFISYRLENELGMHCIKNKIKSVLNTNNKAENARSLIKFLILLNMMYDKENDTYIIPKYIHNAYKTYFTGDRDFLMYDNLLRYIFEYKSDGININVAELDSIFRRGMSPAPFKWILFDVLDKYLKFNNKVSVEDKYKYRKLAIDKIKKSGRIFKPFINEDMNKYFEMNFQNEDRYWEVSLTADDYYKYIDEEFDYLYKEMKKYVRYIKGRIDKFNIDLNYKTLEKELEEVE